MEQQTWLTRIALRCCDWSERWFPDPYVFAALGVVVVGLLAIAIGVSPAATAYAFGDGFWSLIPFTMQMCFIVIGGYVVAASPRVATIRRKLSASLARVSQTCQGSKIKSLRSTGREMVFLASRRFLREP